MSAGCIIRQLFANAFPNVYVFYGYNMSTLYLQLVPLLQSGREKQTDKQTKNPKKKCSTQKQRNTKIQKTKHKNKCNNKGPDTALIQQLWSRTVGHTNIFK